MIVSASRRTDIPMFYGEWFRERILAGEVLVRNPFFPRQVSRISLSPEVVDCIVFWTKNPEPMLRAGVLEELHEYAYYFQFTLTSYGRDVEPGLPKKECLIETFQRLSEKLSAKRVIWRYDPILFNPVYTQEFHLEAYEAMAQQLKGYTEKCVLSFVDRYRKNEKSMRALEEEGKAEEELRSFASRISKIAGDNHIKPETCAEEIDLAFAGISHGACIDKALIEQITGCQLKGAKAQGQRNACGCMESVDIGVYDTCPAGCRYCYANVSPARVQKYRESYDRVSPLLCSTLQNEDKVTTYRGKSLKAPQYSLFT